MYCFHDLMEKDHFKINWAIENYRCSETHVFQFPEVFQQNTSVWIASLLLQVIKFIPTRKNVMFCCCFCFLLSLLRGRVVLGYSETEICMKGSGYQFIHAADMMYCADNHMRSMFAILPWYLHKILMLSGIWWRCSSTFALFYLRVFLTRKVVQQNCF